MTHGVPQLGLVPWVKLTQARLGYHGSLTDTLWLYLWPRPDWDHSDALYDWSLLVGAPGSKAAPLCRLQTYTTEQGQHYLAGSLGLAWLVAYPGGIWPHSKKAFVSLYWALSPYTRQ
jgi:hypothetical protein